MPTQKTADSKILEEFNASASGNTPESAELERERLVSLINSMADGVIATDEHANIVLYNGAALNILDVNTTLYDKKIDEAADFVDSDSKPVDISKLIVTTKTQTTSRDYRLVYSADNFSNIYLSIAPVRLGFGKEGTKGFVILLRDITREKSLEEERDEFISVVSHELRTPIAIAEGNIGNAEFIVNKSGGNEQIKSALKQAHEQILFLSGMINDLATLSRAERGKLEVDIEAINVHELIKSLTEEHTPAARKKGLELRSDLASDLEVLYSSELYVREILQNFITNAIKYTEKGSVTIGARKKVGGTLFEVTDTGIGISRTDQKRIFDKFFRSEDFRTRAHSGTGLGLYVTNKLARLVRAEISLESEINKGSVFSIFIPSIK